MAPSAIAITGRAAARTIEGMEILSTQFLAALAAIVVIDLALAGDNAIVIALAARNLPPAERRRAIAWGTVGAVAVRIGMTVAVVWLLGVPGLMAAGGLVLAWIAFKLMQPAGGGDGHGVAAATGFWSAMRTIVVADAAMGLDNVLAVAGAAHGSFLLVALGLAISIPIVVWGSTLVLGWIERYPWIVHVGVAVLAWTAAQMIAGEPMVRELVGERRGLTAAIYVVVFAAVFGLGFAVQRRRAAEAAA